MARDPDMDIATSTTTSTTTTPTSITKLEFVATNDSDNDNNNITPAPASTSTSTSTSPSRSAPLRWHNPYSYTLCKWLFLFFYNGMLSSYLDGHQYHMYKYISFIIGVPLVKWFTLDTYPHHPESQQPRLESHLRFRQYIISVIIDIIIATFIIIGIPMYLSGWYAVFITPITGIIVISCELIQYFMMDYGTDSTYVIKLSKNPLDYSLPIAIAAGYLYLGLVTDAYARPTWSSFPWYMLVMFVMDLVFGICHWYSHHVPWLKKKHMIHHQYKRADLNLIATFWSEWIDSWTMQLGYFAGVITAVIAGGDARCASMDLGMATVNSHGKYSSYQMNTLWCWEYDALDLIFNMKRLSAYHTHHHHDLQRNLGSLGFVKDEWLDIIAPKIAQVVGYDTRIKGKTTGNKTTTTKHE